MELKTVNALEYVKAHPELFLAYGKVQLHELATKIATDAISIGVFPVTIDCLENWWVVAADKNWLKIDTALSIQQLFSNLVPNPKAGQNASRNEIVLNVYANNVVLCLNGDIELIKGNDDVRLRELIEEKYPQSFLIAFN